MVGAGCMYWGAAGSEYNIPTYSLLEREYVPYLDLKLVCSFGKMASFLGTTINKSVEPIRSCRKK